MTGRAAGRRIGDMWAGARAGADSSCGH
jgi:hypothetical protein